MTSHTIILGAGPAGLGAAFQLARRNLGRVTVIEQHTEVGGNAGSFPLEGLRVDYGSHRLHPTCEPRILQDLQQLLGDALLLRPRHGRIRLRNRWIRFPLRPLDLALRLPPSFLAGVAWDIMRKPFAGRSPGPETFASVLERGLGHTICRDFYFPYARKIWGAAPDTLSPVQARRRVSGNSPAKILRKIAHAIPGLGPLRAGQFYYPRLGYGQISDCLAQAVRNAGGEIILGARVTGVSKAGQAWQVRYTRSGESVIAEGSQIWSTIPASVLVNCLSPSPPAHVLSAAGRLAFRAMVLIYLFILLCHNWGIFEAYVAMALVFFLALMLIPALNKAHARREKRKTPTASLTVYAVRWPNPAAPGNRAITLQCHAGRPRRAVPEQQCYA